MNTKNIFYFNRSINNYPIEQCKMDVLDALETCNQVEVMKSEKLNNEWSKTVDGNSILYFSFFPESQKYSILFSVSVNETTTSVGGYTFITVRADKPNNSWQTEISTEDFAKIATEVKDFIQLFFDDVQQSFFNEGSIKRIYREREAMGDYNNSNPIASIVLIVVTIILGLLIFALGVGSLIF